MRTQITTAIAMLIATVSTITSAQAQVYQGQFTPVQQVQPQVQVQPYVAPTHPPVAPPQQNQFYFGVNVHLNRGYHGTTLRITSVTPGSPASVAGLEVGDEIRTLNGRDFNQASDSFHAVALMNSFVNYSSQPAPAAAAAIAQVQAYVSPQATAQMLVRNVRNGQNVWVNVYPQRRGWSGPAPAAAAPTYTAPAPTTPATPAAPTYSNSTH